MIILNLSIEEYLLEDEKILCQCSGLNYKFYATNKRIIKHAITGPFGAQDFYEIPYNEITSLSLETKRNNSYFGIGLILITSGIIIYAIPQMFLSSILMIMGGSILLVIGIIYPQRKLKLIGPNLKTKIWTLNYPNPTQAAKFIRTVKQQLNKLQQSEKQ